MIPYILYVDNYLPFFYLFFGDTKQFFDLMNNDYNFS